MNWDDGYGHPRGDNPNVALPHEDDPIWDAEPYCACADRDSIDLDGPTCGACGLPMPEAVRP